MSNRDPNELEHHVPLRECGSDIQKAWVSDFSRNQQFVLDRVVVAVAGLNIYACVFWFDGFADLVKLDKCPVYENGPFRKGFYYTPDGNRYEIALFRSSVNKVLMFQHRRDADIARLAGRYESDYDLL